MNALINAIYSFLTSAKTTIGATTIYKGIDTMPEIIPIEAFPYVAIDDGGERVETAGMGATTQQRVYSVVIEMGVYQMQYETSLTSILNLSDKVKAEIEKSANRQKDGHVWGVNIVGFQGDNGAKKFFRGRTVTIEYTELEDRAYSPY
jgi:hypothetical protein